MERYRINSELVAPSKPSKQPKNAEYLATKSKKTLSTVTNKIKPRSSNDVFIGCDVLEWDLKTETEYQQLLDLFFPGKNHTNLTAELHPEADTLLATPSIFF